MFERNIPHQQVEYEFFNAIKQIQMQIEKITLEGNKVKDMMQNHKPCFDELCTCDVLRQQVRKEEKSVHNNNRWRMVKESQKWRC